MKLLAKKAKTKKEKQCSLWTHTVRANGFLTAFFQLWLTFWIADQKKSSTPTPQGIPPGSTFSLLYEALGLWSRVSSFCFLTLKLLLSLLPLEMCHSDGPSAKLSLAPQTCHRPTLVRSLLSTQQPPTPRPGPHPENQPTHRSLQVRKRHSDTCTQCTIS